MVNLPLKSWSLHYSDQNLCNFFLLYKGEFSMNKYCIILCFLLAVADGFSQRSKTLQTNPGFETGFTNSVVASEDGYYLFETTYPYPNPGSQDMLVSYYDNCHEHVWSYRYASGYDIQVDDVLIHDDRLVILAGSGNKYPLIVSLGMDGERISCFSYHNSSLDNHFNLQVYEDSYHIYGPSDGPSHFAIDDSGAVLFANVLKSDLTTSEVGAMIPFGCTILSNGQSLRRLGDVIVAVSYEQEILWAHQFASALDYSISERKPVEVEDGFVMLMQIDNSMTSLVKFNFDGEVVWNTHDLNINESSVPLEYRDGVISIVSSTDFLDSNRLALIEVEESSGEVISSQYFEFDEFNGINFPAHTRTADGDYVISGSVLQDFSNGEWEDLVWINPQMAECHEVFDISLSAKPEINFTDVTDRFELLEVFPTVETRSLFFFEEEQIFYNKCIDYERITIDTSLDCSNVYVFDDPFPGARYLWSDGLNDSIRIFDEETNIEVIIEDCGISKELLLQVSASDCNCNIYVPNVITLGAGNPENGELRVFSNCAFDQYQLSIYDRWGNRVFFSEDSSEFWSGVSSGKNLSAGVYAYRMEWRYDGRIEEGQKWGTVTVIN